jgi:hypothetical protein
MAYEPKTLSDGSENPKYVDLLEEDKPIAGQKFVCISFVSPENVLKNKDIYFFKEFLKQWELSKSMEKYVQFLNFISHKFRLPFDDLMKDFEEFVKEQKDEICNSSLEDDYRSFLDKNDQDLENAFNTENNFQTSTRGIKVRGVYPTLEEAELRCKMLREMDPSHDIMVGPVGLWMPWHPEAYKTGRVEYLEEELNQLMHEKTQNESFAKSAFEQRVKDTKKKAIEENIKHAEKTGASLTQTIDEQGNLVGVNNLNTQEATFSGKEQDEISAADIRKELFEGDNIVVGKTDNGQSELISGPFATKTKSD